jgi:flagellar basal-body rod modification protein FlgD
MTPGIISSNSTPAIAAGQTPPPAPSASNSVTKNMFLQLLVAQLKHQDPLNPTDGTQFLTQLAQFQQLEQTTNSGEDITAIRQDLDKLMAAAAPSATPVSQP